MEKQFRSLMYLHHDPDFPELTEKVIQRLYTARAVLSEPEDSLLLEKVAMERGIIPENAGTICRKLSETGKAKPDARHQVLEARDKFDCP